MSPNAVAGTTALATGVSRSFGLKPAVMTGTPAGLRSALWLPIFDELADPVAVARLAAEAEEAQS